MLGIGVGVGLLPQSLVHYRYDILASFGLVLVKDWRWTAEIQKIHHKQQPAHHFSRYILRRAKPAHLIKDFSILSCISVMAIEVSYDVLAKDGP